jgi:hypothetical protein
MKRVLLVLAIAFAVAGLSACNTPKAPDAAAAQSAVDAAKSAGVDSAKSADMKAAEDKLAAAKAEIDKQNKKFSMMRDYKAADGMLNEAKAAADKALADKKAADEAAAKAAAEEAAKKKGGKKPAAKADPAKQAKSAAEKAGQDAINKAVKK